MRSGGGRWLPKPSLAPSTASEATPALDASVIRNLDSAFSRGDSAAASLCSSGPATAGAGVGAAPNFYDSATQTAALRVVNAFLAPAAALRGPLPAAGDIQAALHLLVDRLHLPRNDATFEDDLIQDFLLLECPYKVTSSALKALGAPHSWPVLLSVLHWLTLLCYSQGDDLDAPGDPSNDLLLHTTQSYSHFLLGDAAAVAALDEQYASNARMTGEASIATVRALEKEAEELETKVNKLISGPSRREALEAEKEALIADIQKFEAVVNASQYEDDEAFARALQDAEERDVADRPMALVGIGDWRAMEQDDAGDEEEDEDDGVHTQDAWEDVDPNEYSYEELIALGEVVGTESEGLAADTIASLPSVTYQAQGKQDGNMEQCVICRVEFDEGESLVALPCKHPYHSECINQWLQLKKVCPMCSAEVSTSVNKQA
ncbi:kinetochore protein NDC80 homolog isoform X1 [Miscanthus floridulus]|uniref:kinetochore protein NDC80 homolog isoform X1 n=1 Tax=Miscanthus floridulus TaxID=154761 RepID=UPI00345A578A